MKEGIEWEKVDYDVSYSCKDKYNKCSNAEYDELLWDIDQLSSVVLMQVPTSMKDNGVWASCAWSCSSCWRGVSYDIIRLMFHRDHEGLAFILRCSLYRRGVSYNIIRLIFIGSTKDLPLCIALLVFNGHPHKVQFTVLMGIQEPYNSGDQVITYRCAAVLSYSFQVMDNKWIPLPESNPGGGFRWQ